MYGIKQIGFTYAVIPANTNDTFIKLKWTITIVFELGDWYGMKVKQSVLYISVKKWEVWCEKGNKKYVE